MRFRSFLPLSLAVLLGAGACASRATQPRVDPPSARKAANETRSDQEKKDESERRHVAPPPAYGNKVVMASGPGDGSEI